MAFETVVISVQDDQIVPQPLDGVVVRVFDATGTTLITEATSGSYLPGKAQITLNGAGPTPVTYQLRFYISGGSVVSPQYIEVYSPAALAPTGANSFLINAAVFVLPQAANPRLCRASGYIYGPSGAPRRGVDIHFIPCFNPLVVDGIGVLGERVAVRTDKDGYVSVDLFRFGMYLATVESQENTQREVAVPDRSSVNISNLLFPVVVAAEFNPSSLSVGVGGSLVVTPEFTASDYRVLAGSALEDVQYATDDQSVATVVIGGSTVTIHGISVGSTNLRVTRKDTSIVYIPDVGIVGGVVPISVS